MNRYIHYFRIKTKNNLFEKKIKPKIIVKKQKYKITKTNRLVKMIRDMT